MNHTLRAVIYLFAVLYVTVTVYDEMAGLAWRWDRRKLRAFHWWTPLGLATSLLAWTCLMVYGFTS